MGQSHFKSNYIGFAGTEYIASVAAIKNLGTLQVSKNGDTSNIQLGATQRLFVGPSNTAASVVAEATAIAGATIVGGIYMSRVGNLWILTSDTTASPVGLMA